MTSTHGAGFQVLKELALAGRAEAHRARCELCAAELTVPHGHLVDRVARKLACACEPCALALDRDSISRWKRPRKEVSRLAGFAICDEEWSVLGIPVQLAFFLRSSSSGDIEAYYPSPAGAISATVDRRRWDRLTENMPRLQALESDVEALLVDRLGEPPRYLLVPIDECYRLVGLLRSAWRGWSGGETARDEVSRLLADLEARAERR